MHETEVAFFIEGERLSGLLRSPDEVSAPVPAIVQGPGWLGLKHAAISVGTLCSLVGDRVVLGFGAGTFDHEFDVIDMAGVDRVGLVRSNAEILRRLLTEDGVTYRDDVYSFDNISIEPSRAPRCRSGTAGQRLARPAWLPSTATAGYRGARRCSPSPSGWPP